MKFDKLRLLGFKSFVEPTEFSIENGLTGVVGPNGCGKSNLVEALRWVMGESSYKNMRASGMDDVIFSGSGNRPARNMAEVSLFLNNIDRTAPAAFNDSDELQVMRRIEREAGSNYRINGKDARAKDVQLLFADASTGARSPSMVGQGRIGELISAKPTARRALLEEAAGISGLHSRRHEAELRLRAAETNLERLEDVLTQLESQLESLKRQARQASRYSILSADIRTHQAIMFHLNWVKAKEAEATAQSELSQATTLVAERAQVQTETSKNQAVIASNIPSLRENEVKAAAALQHLTITRNQIDDELSRLANRRSELENRVQQLLADIEREQAMAKENDEDIERLSAEARDLNEQITSASDGEEELTQLFKDADAKSKASEIHLNELTAKAAEAKAFVGQNERRAREMAERLLRIEAEGHRNREQISDLNKQMAGMPEPEIYKTQQEKAEAALKIAETDLAEAEKKVDLARQKEQESRGPVQEAAAFLKEVETEARTLSGILNADSNDLFPAIVDALTVTKGYEKALGAALGEDLDAPADAGAAAYWAGSDRLPNDPELPEGVKVLSDYVKAPDVLLRRLSQIGVISADGAEAVQKKLASGQRLVSLEGDLWRWDGYRATANAPTAAAQKLAQKNRLKELDEDVSSARQKLQQAEQMAEKAKVALHETSHKERDARDNLRQAQAALKQAGDAVLSCERTVGQLASQKLALESTAARLKLEIDEALKLKQEADLAVTSNPDVVELEAAMQKQQLKVQQERAILAEARSNRDGLMRELDLAKRRLLEIEREKNNWAKRAQNAAEQLNTLKSRHNVTAQELENLDDQPGEISAKRRSISAQIEQAEATRKEAADLLAQAENNQRLADQAAKEAANLLSEAKEARARNEERVLSAQSRMRDIETRILDEMECMPHEVHARTGLGADDELPHLDTVEKKLEKLKIERERLGAVNLRAEAEQVEITQKRDDLVSEQKELIEAIAKLRGGIGSLNRQGRERLLAAFDVVNDQFRRLFVHLFGGGTAELQLVESDDPLEAGLEILARPPGKKPQTMTLLSGGEQALTAMALIFAVFLTNPAPICVLDEVDAPLDDHNVERFCNLLDEMVKSTKTRFLVVTHNPITMARMDRLFGVTMAERGVSQLVSVDLQEAETLRDAS